MEVGEGGARGNPTPTPPRTGGRRGRWRQQATCELELFYDDEEAQESDSRSTSRRPSRA